MRKKLEQLITELVHQRDVVRLLRNKNITNVEAFEWLYYMRFYFYPKTEDVLKRLQIKMSNAPFDYGFEYLGVAEKLIQTPLTDRCYLTLTQGLYFRFEDMVTIDMMFSHYLKRLKQNNFDDALNYLVANQSGVMEFENKNENDVNTQVRIKAADSIKIFFESNNLVQKALEAVQEYNHVMEFTKIRVIESMFALLKKGTENIIEYNDNHSEFPMIDEQIFVYMSKWLVISIILGFGGSLNRANFSEKLKSFTSDIEFPNDRLLCLYGKK